MITKIYLHAVKEQSELLTNKENYLLLKNRSKQKLLAYSLKKNINGMYNNKKTQENIQDLAKILNIFYHFIFLLNIPFNFSTFNIHK